MYGAAAAFVIIIFAHLWPTPLSVRFRTSSTCKTVPRSTRPTFSDSSPKAARAVTFVRTCHVLGVFCHSRSTRTCTQRDRNRHRKHSSGNSSQVVDRNQFWFGGQCLFGTAEMQRAFKCAPSSRSPARPTRPLLSAGAVGLQPAAPPGLAQLGLFSAARGCGRRHIRVPHTHTCRGA